MSQKGTLRWSSTILPSRTVKARAPLGPRGSHQRSDYFVTSNCSRGSHEAALGRQGRTTATECIARVTATYSWAADFGASLDFLPVR